MDAVHDPDSRSWISPKVHLKTYFEAFWKDVRDAGSTSGSRTWAADRHPLSASQVKRMVSTAACDELENDSDQEGLDDALFREIESICDVENLGAGAGEPTLSQRFIEPMSTAAAGLDEETTVVPRFSFAKIPESGRRQLRCLAMQQQLLDNATQCDRNKRQRFSRHANGNWFDAAPPKPTRTRAEMASQFVVVVRVYRPMKKDSPSVNLALLKYAQEIHVLGSNTLSDLRDLVKCPTDLTVPGDVSDDPPWKSERPRKPKVGQKFLPADRLDGGQRMAKDIYKSGFIYIEGCFYNDTRWPDCIDYSQVVREWAESKRKRHVGPFTTGAMETMRVEDLEIRFGYPYVYVHQGQHEHLVSFTEARLLSSDDPQRPVQYPFERSVGTHRSRFCMACSGCIAKWVTTGNPELPESPFFFCDECFRSYNYDREGNKVGHFEAYPYVDINAL